jgi:tRNA-specific 2-thiouridylase
MATGHYARLRRNADGSTSLLKGLDEKKDQTYVLSVLDQDQLRHSLFPIGEYQKLEVRELAHRFNLDTAERPDSQDLCFLAGEDYRAFLSRNIPDVLRPGEIIDRRGDRVGEHQGLAFYTIGQRKGLGISSTQPFYVIDKLVETNQLVVGEAGELGKSSMLVGEVHWLDDLWGSGSEKINEMDVDVKIRYKANPVQARIILLSEGRVRVQFNHPLRDITPGQRAVFYQGDRCLGGGTILAL